MSQPTASAALLSGIPDVPNVDGKPQDGRFLAFGDPTAAVGRLVAASSTLPVALGDHLGRPLPPPVPATWTAPVGGVIGFFGGGLVGAMLTGAVWAIFLRPLLLRLGIWGGFFRLLQSGSVLLFGAVLAALLAYVGVRLGRHLAPSFSTQAQPVIRGVISLFLGSDGIARMRHDGGAVETTIVPFAETPFATFGMTRTTTTYQRKTGSTTSTRDSQAFELFDSTGRSRLKLHGSDYGASDSLRRDYIDFHGAAAAERTFHEYWAPRVIAAVLSNEGAVFPFPRPGGDHFRVAPGRIELVRGGNRVSFAPTDVTRLAVEGGTVILTTAATGEVRVPLAQLCNGKLFLVALKAQGIVQG